MGKQEKIRGAGVRALMIFRRILNIKNKAIEQMKIDLDKLFNELAEKKELDRETAEILRNVYLNRRIETMEDIVERSLISIKNEIRAKKQDRVDRILLTLSDEGDLYREPKEKYCYPMKKSGLRLDIIRFLVDKKGFTPGDDINIGVGKEFAATSYAIHEINRISQDLLHLPKSKEYNLIISKSREGYKLNPIYPITIED